MLRWVVGIFVLLASAGGVAYYLGDDPLRAQLDRRWPPLTVDTQRQAAIVSAAAALEALATPNLAAGADVATIRRLALDAVASNGVTKLSLEADRQLLRLTAGFDVTLTPNDLPNDSGKQSLVAALAPQVVGELELILTAVTSMSEGPPRALLVRLVPTIRRVHVEKLRVRGKYDATVVADVIAFLLDRYADNLSGLIAARAAMAVALPAEFQKEFDPSRSIKIDLKEAPGLKLSLSARPIRSPFALIAAAVLIDGGKVVTVAKLAPLDEALAQSDPGRSSFEDVRADVHRSLRDGLGMGEPPPGIWTALGKALVARSLDSAFAQAQPCLGGSGPIPEETFEAKIPTPDGTAISCDPKRQCDLHVDKRDCRSPPRCTHNKDTRDCHGIGKLGCEIAKATQNQVYDRAFDLCNGGAWIVDQACEAAKSTQNGLYAADKLECETEKNAERVACEIEKGFIVGLHRTGNIGNVHGRVAGTGSLKLCFRAVHFSDALDKLTMSVAASGSAAFDTHFKFVPLDVGGHILCPFPWTADRNIAASIPQQAVGASVSMARRTDAATLTYQGRLDALSIGLHFQPSPLSLVLQNVNFQLACPVTAGLIDGLTIGLAPFIPEFLKDYTYKLKPVEFSFVPNLPTQSVLGHAVEPKLSETPLALIIAGTP